MIKVSSKHCTLSSIEKPKLCRDCKFFRPASFFAPQNQCGAHYDLDLVTGERTWVSASLARNFEEYCGSRALNFERKKGFFDAWREKTQDE